jgi:hypothetical protein
MVGAIFKPPNGKASARRAEEVHIPIAIDVGRQKRLPIIGMRRIGINFLKFGKCLGGNGVY